MAAKRRISTPPPIHADNLTLREGAPEGVPNVGDILKRLRLQRGLSLHEVATASGLSVSFLSQVERGRSDISLGRLARLAQYFDHDVGSLLGYSARRARPHFVGAENRVMVDRGPGIRYEVLRIPGTEMEVILTTYEPHAGFRKEIVHEGIDIFLVTLGEVVLSINGVDYVMRAGECAVHSGAYRHGMRNDSDEPAASIAVTTESVF
jgi:transcriptional regulator with XRE-family HTH domain